MSKFRADRGGHAPGHLREAFEDWVDDGMEAKTVGEELFYDGAKPVGWLLGQLWNCTDIMPWLLCKDIEDMLSVDMPQGSTYAKAVREVKYSLYRK